MQDLTIDNKICILIQGPLNYYNEIIKSYEPYKDNVIISTNDKSLKALYTLHYKNFIIVNTNLAQYPGRANINNQIKTTYEGIKKAEQIGFDYILKISIFVFNFNSIIQKS